MHHVYADISLTNDVFTVTGSLGQYNSNANIQNEANPHGSLGAPVFISTSSSHTENIQRFPDDLSGPNFLPHQERVNIIPSNDRGAGVFRRDIDLNAEYVENNHYTNQNVSVGLSLHPFKPDGLEDQSDSNNSDSMAVDSENSFIVDEQGVDSSSVNMRFLSCNRSSEHACRELLIGESSSTAVQARNPISQAAISQVNASNSLNMSAPHIGPPNVHQQQFSEVMYGSANIFPVSFEAGVGRGTTRPFYDGVHFNNARQNGSSQFNIHHQIAANPQAFLSSGMLPMGHTRNYQVNLPTQRSWYHQDFPSFYSQAQTSVGTVPYVQPFVRVPNFHETPQASPWANVMGPRSVPAPFSPVYNVRRGGTAEPFYNPNNNSRNIMLGPQTGRAVQSYNLANMNYGNVTANYLGNFASSSHYGSFSGSHLSNIPTGAGNHSAAASSHSPLNLGPSAVSQEMGLTIGFGNARSQNQRRTVPRSDNQSGVNTGPPISAEARSNLVAEVCFNECLFKVFTTCKFIVKAS